MLRFTEISSFGQFADLESGWKCLVKDDPCPPFMSHDWFCACIEAYGADKSLATFALWDNHELIAVAPLWIQKAAHRRTRVRILTFITCPDTVFVDFIVDKNRREDAVCSLYEHLTARSDRWDIIQFGKWLSDSPNRIIFSDMSTSRRARLAAHTDSAIPYVEIRNGWKSFLKERSAKFRKTRRNIENRIARLNSVQVDHYSSATPPNLLGSIMEVSRKGWKASQGVSLANRQEHIRFFEKLISIASQNGWLYVWLLRIEDKTVAMEFDLLADGCAYALRADFDPDFSEISPGTYLESQILKHLADHQLREYCMGPGLNDYKTHLTDTYRTTISMSFYNSTIKGLLLWNIENRIIPPLRSFRRHIMQCFLKIRDWCRPNSVITRSDGKYMHAECTK